MTVTVILQPKSGGVVSKNKEQRIEGWDRTRVNFSDIQDKLFKVGALGLPDSCISLRIRRRKEVEIIRLK